MIQELKLQILYLEYCVTCTEQRIKNGEKELKPSLKEYLDSLRDLEELVRQKTLKVIVEEDKT